MFTRPHLHTESPHPMPSAWSLLYAVGECTDGDVRLVNGSTRNEGRVEYCYNGYWNILCTDDNIVGQTSYNLCIKLGYSFNSCKSVIHPLPIILYHQ